MTVFNLPSNVLEMFRDLHVPEKWWYKLFPWDGAYDKYPKNILPILNGSVPVGDGMVFSGYGNGSYGDMNNELRRYHHNVSVLKFIDYFIVRHYFSVTFYDDEMDVSDSWDFGYSYLIKNNEILVDAEWDGSLHMDDVKNYKNIDDEMLKIVFEKMKY